MGFSDAITKRTDKLIDMMKRHPNYKPLVPEEGETMVAFTLRWAAHLISPPQEPEESYDLECVDIAVAIHGLRHDINEAWCNYYGIDPHYFDELSLSRTLALTRPADPAKRKFVELLGPGVIAQLEQRERVSYELVPAIQVGKLNRAERYELRIMGTDNIGDEVSWVEVSYHPDRQRWLISNIIDEKDRFYVTFRRALKHYESLRAATRKEGYFFSEALAALV